MNGDTYIMLSFGALRFIAVINIVHYYYYLCS